MLNLEYRVNYCQGSPSCSLTVEKADMRWMLKAVIHPFSDFVNDSWRCYSVNVPICRLDEHVQVKVEVEDCYRVKHWHINQFCSPIASSKIAYVSNLNCMGIELLKKKFGGKHLTCGPQSVRWRRLFWRKSKDTKQSSNREWVQGKFTLGVVSDTSCLTGKCRQVTHPQEVEPKSF